LLRLPGLSRRTALTRLAGGGVAALAAQRLGITAAQDATPTAGGIIVEVLGTGLPAAAPDRMLGLARVTIAPGFTLEAHTLPGTFVGHFEAGAFGFQVLEGDSARVVRAGGGGTPAATDPKAGEPVTLGMEVNLNPGDALVHDEDVEMIPPGTEVILNPGDVLVHDEDVVAVNRNAGDEPVVFLAAVLFITGEPFVAFVAGTPAAGA
jgi:hypothetical protein